MGGAVEMRPTWQGDVKFGTLVAPGPLALDVLACSHASLSGAMHHSVVLPADIGTSRGGSSPSQDCREGTHLS